MTVAHVTGAARGIGKAIALRLAQDGHDVAVSDLPSMGDELAVTRKELEGNGVRAAAFTGDISDPESVRRLVADTAEELGSLDVFVANAGIAQTKALLDVTPEEYDKVHAVNGRGVFLCYTEAARQMIKQGTGGKIIGACSIAGHKGFPLLGVYSSSKFGVRRVDPVRSTGMGRTRHHRQRVLPRDRRYEHVGRGGPRLRRHQQRRRRRVDEGHRRRHHPRPGLHRRGRRRLRVLPRRPRFQLHDRPIRPDRRRNALHLNRPHTPRSSHSRSIMTTNQPPGNPDLRALVRLPQPGPVAGPGRRAVSPQHRPGGVGRAARVRLSLVERAPLCRRRLCVIAVDDGCHAGHGLVHHAHRRRTSSSPACTTRSASPKTPPRYRC